MDKGRNVVVRKNMRLRQDLIDRARSILGTRTETETVEQALELVLFREEVSEGSVESPGRIARETSA